MNDTLKTLCWPLSRLGEAIAALGRMKGFSPHIKDIPAPPPDLGQNGDDSSGKWIEATAAYMGLEAEPVQTTYAEFEKLLRDAGPAIFRFPGEGEGGYLILLGKKRQSLSLLGPDLTVRQFPTETVRQTLCGALENPLLPEIDRMLSDAGVPPRQGEKARRAILHERLSSRLIRGCWLLRLPPGTSFRRQLHRERLPGRLFALIVAHTTEYLLWILSWWIVGLGALQGRLDRGWMIAWILILLTVVPFRLAVSWLEGRVAIGAGGLLKQRLLYGALRLEPEEIRHRGAGQLLGQVIESEAVESLAMSGGLQALVAAVELALAMVILSAGAGSGLLVFFLLIWILVTVLLGVRYYQHRRRWTEARLNMTHDLVERMVGHRTRLAQEARERWYLGEDQILERHLGLSGVMDHSAARLMALVPRGWMALGLLGIAPSFISGSSGVAAIAIALGGIILAFRAFKRLTAGLGHIAGAAIAWKQVATLFHAAARPEISGAPIFSLASGQSAAASGDRQTVIDAHDLFFSYSRDREPVLRGCTLRVKTGDRFLLEGPSGGGKSTLASLLTGLRCPQSGLLLLRGLDRQTLGGENWRRRVVSAPQFHENHVLTGTFAFNLLMGRGWPPEPEDFVEADNICRELGLGELLDRMPAGLLQVVGETGWQLSHGEKSRLYIARALLQGAEMVILDESFAALDPENLRQAMRCVLNRTDTLLVIAHP